MPRKLTAASTLGNLRKEAKDWLKALRKNQPQAFQRFAAAYPDGPVKPVLRDVQHALAREYTFENWTQLQQALEPPVSTEAWRRKPEDYQRAAQDFVRAFKGDASALDRLNRHYRRLFTSEDLSAEIWRRVYAFRQRAFRETKRYLKLEEAQSIVAQDAGFGSWPALMEAAAAGAPPQGAPYVIDSRDNRVSPPPANHYRRVGRCHFCHERAPDCCA